MTKRDALVLSGILLLALGVRAGVLWGCEDVKAVTGDGVRYFNDAADILSGRTYTGSRAPGYSAVIAAAQYIYPADKVLAFQWSNVLLGVLAVCGVYAVGVSLSGRRMGELAALFISLDPRHVTHALYPMSENAYLPLSIWGLWLVIAGLRTPSIGRAIIAGVVFALATLVRSMMMYFIPVAALLVLLLGAKRWRSNLVFASVMVGTAVLTIAPWTYRNYQEYNRFIPVGFHVGGPLVIGNVNPERDRKERELRAEVAREVARNLSPDDPPRAKYVDIDAALKQKAIDAILERPIEIAILKVKLYGARLLEPGGHFLHRGGQDPKLFGEFGCVVILWTFRITQAALILIAPFGLWRCRLRLGDSVILLYMSYGLFLCLAVHLTTIRFQLFYLWVIMLFAARAFVDLPQWNWRRGIIATVVFGLVCTGLTFNVMKWQKVAAKASSDSAEITAEGMRVWDALKGRSLSGKELLRAVRTAATDADTEERITAGQVKQYIRQLNKAGHTIERAREEKDGTMGEVRFYRPDAPPVDPAVGSKSEDG